LMRNLYNKQSELQHINVTSVDFQLDFWKAPTALGHFADVMAEPSIAKPLVNFLKTNNISHIVTIDDVQRLTIEREGRNPLTSAVGSMNGIADSVLQSFLKRSKDVTPSRNKAKFVFGEYHSYNEMIKWLNDIEYFYPHMAKVFTIGTTYEGRHIRADVIRKPYTPLQIGNPIYRTDKRIIWIDGGIHAREWAAVHTALYFIDQLISQYGVDPQITSYVDTLNFYIIPVANPDGYEYSRSDITPQTRFWRKNRGQQICKKDRWRRERCCGGVDLNRNFDFHWGETGSSSDSCSEIYQGSGPFSEPETRAIRDKILSPELYGKVDAFITLHTYSQMWIHPFNHQRNTVPSDVMDLEEVGRRGVKALESVYGTKYRFGTGADILYPSAGGSDDWAKAKGKVKYVYLLELRPDEDEWDGFLLDKRELIPTGRETWAGVKVVIDAVMKGQRAVAPAVSPTPMGHLNQQNAQFRAQQRRRTELHRRLDGSSNGGMSRVSQARDNTVRVSRPSPLRLPLDSRTTVVHSSSDSSSMNCVDRSPWCTSWIEASPDVCQTSKIYMVQECARSCQMC
uniref:ShKT domain-containing protein n=1 Tax=Anisakis simplex TaxID=6269 RepID=A0A0M3JSW8_ANISI